jgi:hypothetical protein
MLKKYRRVLAFAAALVLLLTVFAGCSSEGRTPPGAQEQPQQSQQPLPEPEPQPQPEPEPES